MNPRRHRYAAFISYAHRYKPWVKVFHQHLEHCLDHVGRPHRVFLDETDLGAGGPSWTTQLQTALDQSARLILLVTPEAMASPRVAEEWEGLASHDRSWRQRLLRVDLVETPIPPFLATQQPICFVGHDDDAYLGALQRLVGALLGREDAREMLALPPGLDPPASAKARLPAEVREPLIAFLEPLMDEPIYRRAIASGLGMVDREILIPYTSKCAASACIELTITDANPIMDAVKMVDKLRAELRQGSVGISQLDPIRESLLQLRAVEEEEEGASAVHHDSDMARSVAKDLNKALAREESLIRQGGDTGAIKQEILDLKRQLRDGPALRAGDALGSRFSLMEPLGHGGFATVWKAWDRCQRQLVAVKVLHGQYVRDKSRVTRFLRGAREMAALRHPGVVVVHEPELQDGEFHFFVMELLPGGDLRDAMRSGSRSELSASHLVDQVAEALAAAHDRGLVHRDVKPANILLTASGRPKLTDFDLVRVADSTHGTRTGMMGTFLYVAPEAMERPQDAGPPADIFGLGMTAAFLLHGADLPGRALWHTEAFVDGLDCPQPVREIVLQATAKEPEDRFATIAAFREAWTAAWQEPARPESPLPDTPPHASRTDPPAENTRKRTSPKINAKVPEGFQREDWNDRAKAYFEVTRSESPRFAIEQLDAQRRTTRNGNDLYFLHAALETLRESDASHEAANVLDQFFDHMLLTGADRANFESVETRNQGSVSFFATLPAGTFGMGTRGRGGHADEKPSHDVRLVSPFEIGRVAITNQQYREFDPLQPLRSWEGVEDDELAAHPVGQVSWFAATSFCRWLSAVLPGEAPIRLPSEEEWEYACRAESDTEYCSGNGAKNLQKVGWYGTNSKGRTHRVARKKPNVWGLYDMHGNVWEWTAAIWDAKLYSQRRAGFEQDASTYCMPPHPADHADPTRGASRVIRGGGYRDLALRARSAFRFRDEPWGANPNLGFRVVRSPRARTLDPRS